MSRLTTYRDARDGFRSRVLRQGLYDAGHRLMDGVIVNLHGQAHIERRRLENRLFRRDTFAWYERQRIPRIIDEVLASPVAKGRGELSAIARRTMMTLSIDVAGVDLPRDDSDVFERLYELMQDLARASTVAHALGDTTAIVDAGDRALAAFENEFFAASLERRRRLVDQLEAGIVTESDLPRDVLTTLIRNQEQLDLPPEFVLREVAYYPWVGSHSTSAQLVHAMHHIFEWIAARPDQRDVIMNDSELRQRFVHESMRLHPASPVAVRIATADDELKSGIVIHDGDMVTIDVEAANRDPEVFGINADEFDPHRRLEDGTPPWGLSFGHGTHACLGQELAGGTEPHCSLDSHLIGSVALMAGSLLGAGARPDPDDPPQLDPSTTRTVWGRYPVVFSR